MLDRVGCMRRGPLELKGFLWAWPGARAGMPPLLLELPQLCIIEKSGRLGGLDDLDCEVVKRYPGEALKNRA